MKILDAELIASAPNIGMLPESGLPEVAFLGRSNVGKSSLLNGLTRRKKLARTSSTPGKTRDLVLFKVRTDWGEIGLVDLPGYGWAKVSRSERAGWQRMAEDYLAKREALSRTRRRARRRTAVLIVLRAKAVRAAHAGQEAAATRAHEACQRGAAVIPREQRGCLRCCARRHGKEQPAIATTVIVVGAPRHV